MPYEIRKNDSGEFCVHKKDTGENMGCSATREEAEKHMAAMYANESKKMVMHPTQQEVNYVPLSATDGKACANCRWFAGDVQMCVLIENMPADILPTGYCDRWEGIPAMTPEPPEEPDAAVESEPAHEMEMARQEDTTGYIAPDSNSDSLWKSLTGLLQRGLKPGATVLKGADGKRYMLIVTSNSYQDRDTETITTDALKADVNRHWVADDQYVSDNPLLFWHDDRLKVGDLVWGDVRGPFLVELAREAPNPIAKAVFDYREAHPDEKWGASHRFAYHKHAKGADGVYTRIRKLETSILPREAAANALTFSGVIPMTDKRGEYLNKMLGLDNAADLLDKGFDALVAELDKRGVDHKSTEDPNALQLDMRQVLKTIVDLIDAQAALDTRLTEKETALETAQKAFEDKTAVLETVQAELAQLKAQLDARPRMGSRATETEIEPDKLPDTLKQNLHDAETFLGLPLTPKRG